MTLAHETNTSPQPAPTDRLANDPTRPSGALGLVLAGKYELVREIGRGGMGSVWHAKRLGWNASVAVKLMTLPDTPLARERFEREVSLAASLRSPHVVQVLDHGVHETTPFIVMELLEGESLAARLRRLRSLSPSEVLTVVTHLGRALTRAHEAGIVHRDLKPDNVFLVPNADEAIVKVLDFGVAKSFEPARIDGRAITAEGRAVGTPWYMSPEQLRGVGPLDHRIDLWSLAVIACECLTGKRPFHATDFPTLALMLCGNGPRPVPSSLGAVPAGFDDWFAKATAVELRRRFQSAQELVEALRPICGTSRTERMPPLVYEKHRIPPSAASVAPMSSTNGGGPMPLSIRRPKLLAGLCAGAALGLAINFYIYSDRWPSATATPVASSGATLLPAPSGVEIADPAEGKMPPPPAHRPEGLPKPETTMATLPSVPVAAPIPESVAPTAPAELAAGPAPAVHATAPPPSKARSKPRKRKVGAQPAPSTTEDQTIEDRIIRTELEL